MGKNLKPIKYQGYFIEDNKRITGTFQNAIRPVLILAYNMALFPVQGIEQLETGKIKFSSKSLPNFISFYPYFGTLVMMILSLAWFIKKASLLRTLRIIFFGTSWISCALLRELAVHWPQLCRVWAKCEQSTNLGYPKNLALKCHCFIFIYIMTAVCEHGLALSNAFSEAAACGDALRNLCTHWFPQVFNLVPFYRPLAIIIMTINTIATFTFNFVDLLLITTGYILSNLLKQYNRILEEDSLRIKTPSYYWTVKFQVYNEIIELANLVFGSMSKLLLLSFFISVSSICFQLYFNLTPVERSTVGKIYYVISLTYLVARCLLLCIVLGSVHEEGTKVKRFIYDIPSQSYTPVVERFLLHVNTQSTEFSAFGFFNVTRTTIITIMSIVLSYEAIMHQFKTLMIDVEDGQALKRNASVDCSKYLQLGD